MLLLNCLILLLSGLPLVLGVLSLALPLMSSFQLNLSSLTLGAKERLARLDAAGGTFRSLLSPSSSGVGSTALGDGPPPAPSGLSRPAASSGLPSAPGARFLVEHLVASGSVTSGESVVSGGCPAASWPLLLCRNCLLRSVAVLLPGE